MIKLLFALIAIGLQTDDELLQLYGAPEEYYEMERQMQEVLDRRAESEQQQKTARTLMLLLSLSIAAVPLVATCRNIIRHPELRTTKGIASALGIALLGGAVLFGINFGWMYLRLKHGDAFNLPLAVGFTLALAGFAIFFLYKKD